VATGRVFGYRNAGTKGGRHREIEPTQAPIVVHVFEMAAQGFGKRRIADALEAERVPSPTGKGGRTKVCGSSSTMSFITACS